MPLPNEITRPDWIQGRDIELSDGQLWSIPLPRVEFRFTEGGEIEQVPGNPPRETNRKFGERFWSLQEKLPEYLARTDGHEPGSPDGFSLVEYYKLIFAAARDLLLRNYQLTDEQVRNLLTIIPFDQKNQRMWTDLGEAIMGKGSKADGGG